MVDNWVTPRVDRTLLRDNSAALKSFRLQSLQTRECKCLWSQSDRATTSLRTLVKKDLGYVCSVGSLSCSSVEGREGSQSHYG